MINKIYGTNNSKREYFHLNIDCFLELLVLFSQNSFLIKKFIFIVE